MLLVISAQEKENSPTGNCKLQNQHAVAVTVKTVI